MNLVVFDLDDTLYKEIDFLRSAFRYIEQQVEIPCCEDMMHAYREGRDAFSVVVKRAGGKVTKEQLSDWYRYHFPDISLSQETEACLKSIRRHGDKVALVTDGRTRTQGNKVHALGLCWYMDESDIVISESFGSEKPSERNFLYLMARSPEADRYVYVGDNLKKDFVAPNRLGWDTVCLLDDGRNIHPQCFSGWPEEFLPRHRIRALSDLPEMLY